MLFSGYPEKYEDGRLKSIFGSITDISRQKWAEGIQTRKMEEAVELKRQQVSTDCLAVSSSTNLPLGEFYRHNIARDAESAKRDPAMQRRDRDELDQVPAIWRACRA